MKKLLLIALTIPNFVLAEDFKLVCKGEVSKYRNGVLENTSKATQMLEIKQDFIMIDSVTYKNKTFDYGAIKGSSKYIKDDVQIIVDTAQVSNECDKILFNAKLNRSSGMIVSSGERIGTCDGSDFTTATKFKGKCK
tara:strand:+ start:51 stop:461 length:411 start_codon:yes stop_codon:yes gene_type:complete